MNPYSDTDQAISSRHNYKYRYYLVGFLDILGQKDKLRGIKGLPENDQEYRSFVKLDQETRGTVIRFRNSFFKFFKGMYKPRPIPQNLTEDEIEKYRKIKESAENLKPIIVTFSDSIIIYVPLSDDNKVIQVEGILSSVLAIAGSFLTLMNSGTIFRGGLEIGLACEIGSKEIYGPALLKAHDLESKIAKYPRVVIGDELVCFLQKTARNPEKEVQSEINQKMAQKSLDLFMIDADGRYALDYLGKEYRDMAKAKKVFPDMYGKASSFLEHQFSEIKEKKDTNLFLRYLWLADYFENRLALWQESNQEE